MKIVRNTPEQLILQSVPWILGLLLAAGILGLVAGSFAGFRTGDTTQGIAMLLSSAFVGLLLAIFVRRDDLILDRSRDMIELRHATVRGRHKVRHNLHHLKEAVVQTQDRKKTGSRRNKGGPTHRVALILNGGMDAGTHPVTQVYSSGNGAKRAVDAINTWLSMDVDSSNHRA